MGELEAIEYRSPGVQAPDGGPNISWRTGYLSDWEIVLGGRRFPAHRAIVARASEVLAASMNSGYASTSTDLTDLLPAVTHPVFELVLEEIYEGSCEVDDTQLVLLFAVADVLGMQVLFDRSLARIKEKIKIRAVSFLQDVRQLPRTEHLGKIAAAARGCVARDFGSYSVPPGDRGLLQLAEEEIVDILGSENLSAQEDQVFDFIWRYLAESTGREPATHFGGSSPSDSTGSCGEADLWRQCRLAFVSQDRLLRLWMRLTTDKACGAPPMRVLMDALAYRTTLDRATPEKELCRVLEEAYPRVWLSPRRPRHVEPPRDNELDFVMHLPREPEKFYEKGHCIRSSPKDMEGGVRVSILVFPSGTSSTRGSMPLVPIFVEVMPANTEESGGDWGFRRSYFISVWPREPGPSAAIKRLRDSVDALLEEKNPDVMPAEINEQLGSVRWVDKHHFKPSLPDRGWYEFPHRQLLACCDSNGFLWLRARVWSLPGGGRW